MWILLPNIDLHCFVARQFLSRIYALLSVKFPGLKMCECKKNDKYQVCTLPDTSVFVHRTSRDNRLVVFIPSLSFPVICKTSIFCSRKKWINTYCYIQCFRLRTLQVFFRPKENIVYTPNIHKLVRTFMTRPNGES